MKRYSVLNDCNCFGRERCKVCMVAPALAGNVTAFLINVKANNIQYYHSVVCKYETIYYTPIFAEMLFMQTVLVLHNIIRWAVLLFGIFAVIGSISGIISSRNFTSADNRNSFLFSLSCDIQLLIGLGLYFSNEWFTKLKDLGSNMKDTYSRFFTLEHSLLMIIAWVLVHIGRVSVKKAITPALKHKRSLLFFGLALLLILAAIPWPFRDVIARPLYRWFS